MSRERLAAAYEEVAALHNKLSEAYAQVAFDLMGTEQPGAGESAVPSTQSPAPAATQNLAAVDQGECPKHHKPWTPGQYGDYCTAQTDDPAWAKVKPDGKMFCKITPKNADQWLRIQAAA